MATLFVHPEPVVEHWLADRRAKGLDGRDEIWDGVYHVAPHEHSRNRTLTWRLGLLLQPRATAAGLEAGGAFDLGSAQDFRVPDLGYHRVRERHLYMPSAAIVVEVLSPGDETYAKLDFYAAHGVEEFWVLDPVAHRVEVRELAGRGLDHTDRSALLGLTAEQVAAELDWPA